MVKIDSQANLKWGGRARGCGGARCFVVNKINALQVCFGLLWGPKGWVGVSLQISSRVGCLHVWYQQTCGPAQRGTRSCRRSWLETHTPFRFS